MLENFFSANLKLKSFSLSISNLLIYIYRALVETDEIFKIITFIGTISFLTLVFITF